MLPEGLMTVTGTNGGNGLDGVTQGSGVHLALPDTMAPHAVITLNSNAWQEIEIDENDVNFQDSDAGQRLVNPETVETSPGVRVAEGGEVIYIHLLLDGHRTLLAEGVDAESLLPGGVALCNLDPIAEAELFAMFPELERSESSHDLASGSARRRGSRSIGRLGQDQQPN